MEKRVEGLVRQFRDARRHRLRFEALVTALSVLVTGGVFWQLRQYGTALGESGSETEQPGAGRTVVETDADPPEETTRSGIAESPEDWETGLPEFTDETTQQRIAAIAVSQLGYSEGGEIKLSDVGMSRTGYTRYGAWYGNPYGEWNTMFTYFCMYYAGVEKTEIPYGSGCWAWYETLSEKDMIAPCGNEQIGDILFFDTDSDGEPDRTGIVSGTGETEDGVLLSVIEGNCEGAVAEVQYLQGGSDIVGVLSADAYAVAEASLPPEVVLIDYSADSESGIHVDAQAAEGVFPEGTVMRAADVAEDEAMQAAQDTLGENAAIRDAVAVDISFYTADGEEIEPADGNAVSVRISLPAEMQLSGDIYTLVHVDDEGEGELVADAQVTSDGAAFIAESFSVYVLTSNGYTDKDQAITVNGQAVPNSQTNPYVITVGQELEVRYSGDYVNRVDQGNNNNGFTVYNNGSNVVGRTAGKSETAADGYRTAYFTGLNPGICRIVKITGSGNWGSEQYVADDLWVKVVAPDIYVKSSFEYKQIDRVKEWLDRSDAPNADGYVRNTAGNLMNGPNLGRPYAVCVGDTFEIYADGVGEYTLTHYNLNISSSTGYKYELTNSNQEKIRPLAGAESHGPGTTSAKFEALAPGEVEIRFTTAQGATRSMWVRVMPLYDVFNHADMEIADGGKYTFSYTTYSGGQKITTLKVYDAFVSRVNYAKLLDASGEPLALRAQDNGKIEYNFSSDTNDYQKIGESGQTQYELTSAFGRPKIYNINDVKSVEFDVNITLLPNQQCTITDGVPGSWSPISGADEELEHTIWSFDKQAITDAMNKCPMTNGLDFTIRSDCAIVNLQAEKELNGGTLQAGEFTFELVDQNNHVIDTAVNDADGKILFLNQMYSEPGTYTYTVREVIPAERDARILYDETAKTITVDVTRTNMLINGTTETVSVLRAEMTDSPPKFVNCISYRLPDTGGTGTLPYLAGGITLISAAFLLPLIRRRKEDECDS